MSIKMFNAQKADLEREIQSFSSLIKTAENKAELQAFSALHNAMRLELSIFLAQ